MNDTILYSGIPGADGWLKITVDNLLYFKRDGENSWTPLAGGDTAATTITKAFTAADLTGKTTSNGKTTGGVKSYSFVDLGVTSPVIAQLFFDSVEVTGSPCVKLNWTSNGLTVTLSDFDNIDAGFSLILTASGNLLSKSFTATDLTGKTTSNGKTTGGVKSYSFTELGVASPVAVQLLYDSAVIPNSCAKTEWNSSGLKITLADFAGIDKTFTVLILK